MLRLLPFLLIPALAAVLAYWLTRSKVAAASTAAVVLGGMLYIGITG